jgi:SAM-dependent methyltransferase
MHTRTTAENPFRVDRYAFAWHHLPAHGTAHLDFGCHDGSFLRSLDAKGLVRRVGIDAAHEALQAAQRAHPDLELVHSKEAVPLPFPNGSFSSITILDVLEHVVPQRELLREFRRVLEDDGVLIVTVPGQHLFSVLDLGNLKFRFPRLHRWWYTRRRGPAEYEARYVANPDGLIGDIAAEKAWHEHFSRSKLGTLLHEAGFEVVDFDGTGLFLRVLNLGSASLKKVKPVHPPLRYLKRVDAHYFEAANLFCVAKKRRAGA